MEAWETIFLVLGSNAIMGLVYWFSARKQIESSDKQLEKRIEAQREADKRERAREVRGEALVKLRNELARMAGKGAKVGYMTISSGEKVSEEFERALADWGAYMESGGFDQVLYMQYDIEIVYKAESIRLDYEIARFRLELYWKLSDKGRKDEKKRLYDEPLGMIRSNRRKVVEVQSEISKLLEEL